MSFDLPYIISLSKVLEIGPVKFSQIKSYFGSIESAWNAPLGDFMALGFNEKLLASLDKIRRETDPEKEFNKCQKSGVTALTADDSSYPKLLKEIYDPPFILYVRGSLLPEDELSIAVVGSRRMTSYGFSAIESLVPQLSMAGLSIVSGLAFGVDAAAHKATLSASGRAIAVLASGVDKITPYSNESLGRAIIEKGGALVSEFPLGTIPQPFYFPRRNRIISGMSLGVLVIEAAEKSGSLITAHAALEQGREVFSVPSSIFNSLGVGCNQLIKSGAKLVMNATDILEEFNVERGKAGVQARISFPETPEEVSVLNAIGDCETHLDDVVRSSGNQAGFVAGVLTLLEIKGMVKNIGNGYYRKT